MIYPYEIQEFKDKLISELEDEIDRQLKLSAFNFTTLKICPDDISCWNPYIWDVLRAKYEEYYVINRCGTYIQFIPKMKDIIDELELEIDEHNNRIFMLNQEYITKIQSLFQRITSKYFQLYGDIVDGFYWTQWRYFEIDNYTTHFTISEILYVKLKGDGEQHKLWSSVYNIKNTYMDDNIPDYIIDLDKISNFIIKNKDIMELLFDTDYEIIVTKDNIDRCPI